MQTNYSQLASATTQLIEKTSVPATKQNADTLLSIYKMLEGIANGTLAVVDRQVELPP